MAVKTITIDMDAYELLNAAKRGKESFSKVIKRRLQPIRTAKGLLGVLCGELPSEEALTGMEDMVRRRAESPADSRAFDEGTQSDVS